MFLGFNITEEILECEVDQIYDSSARRSSLGLKAVLVLLHVVFVGVLYLLDTDLIRKTREMPCFESSAVLSSFLFARGGSSDFILTECRPQFISFTVHNYLNLDWRDLDLLQLSYQLLNVQLLILDTITLGWYQSLFPGFMANRGKEPATDDDQSLQTLWVNQTNLIRQFKELSADFRRFSVEIRRDLQYMAAYLLLVLATLVQYFITAFSSPGYVIDAMAAGNEMHTTHVNSSRNSILTSRGLFALLICYPTNMMVAYRNFFLSIFHRSWTCVYCNLIQPPRAKHCHDCNKCVLRFDHHCVWLGTCIGKGNHCRFWWYIFAETVVCIWSGVLYISFLRSDLMNVWWKIMIVVVLLIGLSLCFIFLLLLLLFHTFLVLTNQTTYELVRRRRIPYLRGIPERVRPFSKGICWNLYNFCCSLDSIYNLEAVPTLEELEERARPYTCTDMLTCRCC
ncbi:hypothetical protein IEQ34_007653 [Dendrobium chrysotoxum]|uniref:S-acyltransferase n=1 Tax=Dendrobium chrysotoxum TaxID=161865 RepID=A0AAV7H3M1_DENCH|nr:hypothetical protein IEQ34_007653 [Dendrobium chrysotoxum]